MDMIPVGEKGRRMGESSGRAKWKDSVIEHWRKLVEDGHKRPSEICKEYNVPKQTLSDILNFKSRAVTPTRWKRVIVKARKAMEAENGAQ